MIATSISCTKFGGIFKRPRQTSPNSPPPVQFYEKPEKLNYLLINSQSLVNYCRNLLLTNNCFNCYITCINFSCKFTNCLVWILIGVRINIASAGTKQWCSHWKIIILTIETIGFLRARFVYFFQL